MVSGSLETDFIPVNSLTGYCSSLAFGSVTRHLSELKVCFSQTTKRISSIFFRI